MLKIKDDISLNVLEKFGFERCKGCWVLFGNNKHEKNIQIFDTLEIFINVQVYQDKFYQTYVDDKSFEKTIGVLFEMVKSDIIEKVED